MSKIELKGIDFSIGKNKILKDINLTIENGEFFSILGPSGVGKTTIFKIITGALIPKRGSILVDGNIINDVHIEKRNIVMVHQAKLLFPHMTIRENVEFGLKMRKVSKEMIRQKVNSLTEFFNMEEHMKKYPHQLSGGQQQLASLMRALAVDPKVLLLDEPFTGLDNNLKNYVKAYIMKIQKKFSITTIMITHEKEDAFSMSDTIAFLFEGTVALVDKTRNLNNKTGIDCIDEYLGEITTLEDGKIIFSDRIIEIG
ncbi:ABC transporter ATP-binding protein [Clostridium bowmanii]|uniref:ABC transporter ATP-binding protein n=1 Tax=Clostridium bowmanii TaxID=132925 RepID=UPI001C0ADEEA|nr:ABC transporter ATP-binding protein [Clostridium bowmanii]MBU3189552.1 ABC transporter ATP-binding protein [Clostridium bowmanii]MCA1073606.1 ABC transporter ATP-binding protein [Clostridium bowmanii]